MKAKAASSWRSATLSSSKRRWEFQGEKKKKNAPIFSEEFSGISIRLLPQEQLEVLVRDNEQLKSEVRELLNSSALASSSLDHGRASIGIAI